MRAARITVVALVVALGLGALGLGALASAPSAGRAAATAGSKPKVANFHNPRANRYFPLTPGTVSVYRGSEDGEHFRERVTVTYRTKTILGVRTTVVLDVLRRVDGSLAERTRDWYAADHRGNVWYFGESTATYDEHGHLESREGSWQAGVDGAVAGLIMPADPKPTDAYRQEFYAGHAEDQAWIVQRDAVVTVPLGTFHGAVRSFEWTRLEPRVMSVKFYAAGLGIVREQDVAGGNEVFELVAVSHH